MASERARPIRQTTPEDWQTINDLLYYSYSPNCRDCGLPDEVAEATAANSHTQRYETLLTMAVDALKAAISEELRELPAETTHIVPLSSGLDSRALLATLLDHPEVNPMNVQTVTFGTPGTWDYDISQEVAATAGVENKTIDLTAESFDWSLDALHTYASSRDCPGGVFDGYAQSQIHTTTAEQSAIWVGFMGDLSSGIWQPAELYPDWESACEAFASREQFASGLTAPDYDPLSVLPDEPFISQDRLSFEEQLDIALRQQCAIEPVVVGSKRHRTPYTQPAWLEFSLNLPKKYRRKRSLFVDAFSEAFPTLFSLPTDANAGFSLSVGERTQKARRGYLRVVQKLSQMVGYECTHPGTNYLNFRSAFRSGELRGVSKNLLNSLAGRNVTTWLDPQKIWHEHQAGSDYSKEILVLCYAELYLRNVRAKEETTFSSLGETPYVS